MAVPPKRKKKAAAASTAGNAQPGNGKALVIVESPAKCRTIEKILGKSFQVQASMGHIVDLPKSKMGVDLENHFEPQYIVMVAKKKVLNSLKKQVQDKEFLYLACDPDREGEAISWHLGNQLGKGKKVMRVQFQEITPAAIKNAFLHPREIDMNRVGAQQARRILDRIVGYSLSPILWKSIAKGLSAGRVQSVALRLIVDQERKIRAFVPEEYWTVDAEFAKKGTGLFFAAQLIEVDGKKVENLQADDAKALSAELQKAQFAVAAVRATEKRRMPQPPFTTSKLQQESYNRLKMRPTRTMAVAQGLYEGVDLGSGETVGLITYMRTDSVNISDVAMEEVRAYIPARFGAEYLPETPNRYKSKASAQQAHEAIRPTSVQRTPESVAAYLSEEQLRLYSIIWSKFVASQMKPAINEQTSVDISSGRVLFRASGTRQIFAGFTAAWDEEEDGKRLPELAKDDALDLKKLESLQHFTKPPARYTDASLIKTLEELGIGRPSTYAPTIGTIVDRNYVERQGGALLPTELGFLVVDLLVKHFPTMMDLEFTAKMEESLDRIEEGELPWTQVLEDFYTPFKKSLELAGAQIQPVRRLEEKTDEICELCGKPMVIKWGRRGKFLSCSDFPTCRNAKSISTKVSCPTCGTGMLVQRRSRGGKGRAFYGCTRYPECTHISNKLPGADRGEGDGGDPKPGDPPAAA
ncbi:MAG: type I DNA topoisomerase [Candidatus Omnitrophica bacterium]|jgi:DNA topoisomerase-1|nr:type I DNA topoisomerase [Candidatus Omnitrophota bacterium]